MRSSVTGLIVASAYVFGAIAQLAMGTLKDRYGLETGLELLAAVAVVAGALFSIQLLGSRRLAIQGR